MLFQDIGTRLEGQGSHLSIRSRVCFFLFDHASVSDPRIRELVGRTVVVETFCFSYINAVGWGLRVSVSLLSGRDQEVWSLRLLYVYVLSVCHLEMLGVSSCI